ncbi:hypothetical protein ACQRUO_21435, partial [Kitasatospora sp. LaBMicrA B282]
MTDPGSQDAPAAGRAAALDLRLLRALPFATVCVVLAVAGHVAAAGAAVPAAAVLLGWTATAVPAVLAARRERSLAAITGGLALAQLGLHLLFHYAQAAPAAQPVGIPAMPAMPGMAAMPGMPGMAAGASTSLPPHLLLGLSPAMLAAHAVATAVAGWWLRRGEAALWRIVRGTAQAAAATARRWAVR